MEQESDFKDCEKRWVLKRIVDTQEAKRIEQLLIRWHQIYTVIPFDREEYLKKRGTWSFFEKIRSIINLNKTRNRILREGRASGVWALPFDGNCFFSDHGWAQFAEAVAQSPQAKVAVIPMLRVVRQHEFERTYGAAKIRKVSNCFGVYCEP